MSKKEDTILPRKADHIITAEMVGKATKVEDVLIDLFLPKNDNEEIILKCKPNAEQFVKLAGEHEFRINGYDEFSGGGINNKYFIKNAIAKKRYPSIILKSVKDFFILLQADDLTIVCERGYIRKSKKTEGFFRITDCQEIVDPKIFERKRNGEVKIRPYKKYSFVLKCGLQLSFDSYYTYERDDNCEKLVVNQYTVAEFKTKLDPENINEYLREIDDFLLLLSFALSKRCVCTGWFAASNSKIVTFYRRDVIIPAKVKQHAFMDTLVNPNDLKCFLEKTYVTFTKFDRIEVLRNALYPVLRKDKRLTETHFLMLFSILESVLLFYRDQSAYSLILNTSEFSDFENKLHELIKKNFPSIDKDRRKYLYEKIPELNRLSFKSSFELFQLHYNVFILDLWPLIDTIDGVSLSQIRNKIIHGEYFSNNHFDALCIATEHLQILVERIILALLEWEVTMTNISKEYIEHLYPDEFYNIQYCQKTLCS